MSPTSIQEHDEGANAHPIIHADLNTLRELMEMQHTANTILISHLTEIVELKLSGVATGISALDEKLFTATKVQGEKVLAATASLDHRLEEMMNQIHKLEDQTNMNSGMFLTKTEHIAWKSVIEEKLDGLHDFETIVRTKASASTVMVSFIISGVIFLINVIGFAFLIADRVAK